MIAAALFMVTPADIVGKRDLFFGVNIPAKTTFLVTGRATVTASNPFIGLENESMIIHCQIMGLRWCGSCSFRSLAIETAETADIAWVKV
jgi:hypothetical protein